MEKLMVVEVIDWTDRFSPQAMTVLADRNRRKLFKFISFLIEIEGLDQEELHVLSALSEAAYMFMKYSRTSFLPGNRLLIRISHVGVLEEIFEIDLLDLHNQFCKLSGIKKFVLHNCKQSQTRLFTSNFEKLELLILGFYTYQDTPLILEVK